MAEQFDVEEARGIVESEAAITVHVSNVSKLIFPSYWCCYFSRNCVQVMKLQSQEASSA